MAPSATDTRRKLIDAATRAFADDGCSPPRSSRSPARPDRRTGARFTGTVNAANAAPPFTLGMDVGKRVVAMANQSLGGMADFALCGTAFDAPPELDNIEAAAFTLPFHIGYLALHERAPHGQPKHVSLHPQAVLRPTGAGPTVRRGQPG